MRQYKMVPTEPTEEMEDSGTRKLWAVRRQTNGPLVLDVYASREVMDADRVGTKEAYTAMLAAAPPASQDEALVQKIGDAISNRDTFRMWNGLQFDMARAVLKMLEADHG